MTSFDTLDVALDAVTPGRRHRVAEIRAGFWREVHIELRRHAGRERLPVRFRGSLRRLAQAAHDHATRADEQSVRPFPRRLVRDAAAARLPTDVERRGRAAAIALGLDVARPLVAVERRNRPDVLADADALLAARDLSVVRVGAGLAAADADAGLAASDRLALDLFLVSQARFVVCAGAELQRLSDLLDRPSLTLNGTDPFTLYPVRPRSLYLLRTAVDLETGRDLTPADTLSQSYFRNQRHHGHREHAAADVTAAVEEMLELTADGSDETQAQSAYRARLVAAAGNLGRSVRQVAVYGPDEGFLGDGRLARVQAERQ